ncbi:MAG: hypothetical protein AABZ32_04620, partial [Bacteroidota bacterium]
MKKIFLSLTSTYLFALVGCGNGKTDDVNSGAPKGMAAADLSAQGLSVLVNVPDSTTGPLEIISNAQGGV